MNTHIPPEEGDDLTIEPDIYIQDHLIIHVLNALWIPRLSFMFIPLRFSFIYQTPSTGSSSSSSVPNLFRFISSLKPSMAKRQTLPSSSKKST